MDIEILEARIRSLKNDMDYIYKELKRYMEEVKQQKEVLKKQNLSGKEAAKLLGYKPNTLYNYKEELNRKGWFTEGYPYNEVIVVREWKKKHGSIKYLPNQKDFKLRVPQNFH